jgi:transposase
MAKEAKRMSRESKAAVVDLRVESGPRAPGETEGARRATGGAPGGGARPIGPLEPGQRWNASRKREVVLRLLRGESMDALSRELGIETYLLEEWKQRALAGMDASLRERKTTSERIELDAALKRLGELMMDNELLLERCRRSGVSPLALRRSGK